VVVVCCGGVGAACDAAGGVGVAGGVDVVDVVGCGDEFVGCVMFGGFWGGL